MRVGLLDLTSHENKRSGLGYALWLGFWRDEGGVYDLCYHSWYLSLWLCIGRVEAFEFECAVDAE
jgi:hypothetical protein